MKVTTPSPISSRTSQELGSKVRTRPSTMLALTLALLMGCGDREIVVELLPNDALIANGATHDFVAVACEEQPFSLITFLSGGILTLLTAGAAASLGRIDAVFYTPEALARAFEAANSLCTTRDVVILDARVEGVDAEVSFMNDRPIVSATPRTAGDARLVVLAQLNEVELELEAPFQSREVTQVEISSCDYVITGTEFRASVRPRVLIEGPGVSDTIAVPVGYGLQYIDEYPGLTLEGVSADERSYTFRAPDEPLSTELRSRYEPDAPFAVEVVRLEDLSLGFEAPERVALGQPIGVAVDLFGSVEGIVCGGRSSTHVESLTPDICDRPTLSSRRFATFEEGTCILRATMDGLDGEVVREILVTPAINAFHGSAQVVFGPRDAQMTQLIAGGEDELWALVTMNEELPGGGDAGVDAGGMDAGDDADAGFGEDSGTDAGVSERRFALMHRHEEVWREIVLPEEVVAARPLAALARAPNGDLAVAGEGFVLVRRARTGWRTMTVPPELDYREVAITDTRVLALGGGSLFLEENGAMEMVPEHPLDLADEDVALGLLESRVYTSSSEGVYGYDVESGWERRAGGSNPSVSVDPTLDLAWFQAAETLYRDEAGVIMNEGEAPGRVHAAPANPGRVLFLREGGLTVVQDGTPTFSGPIIAEDEPDDIPFSMIGQLAVSSERLLYYLHPGLDEQVLYRVEFEE